VPEQLRDQLQITLGTAYTLGRELGGGGMSRVFLAREEALGRDVVVKVLAPELAAGISAERFGREIKLAAALQAPHIVPVHAAGVTTDGLPYYTMPYVRGESLRARLAQGPIPLNEATAILRDVATALEYAHAHGLVHRDIKPENVLLSGRTAVVTDFGIAKALSASKTQAPDGPAGGTLTQLGTSLGTPAYMAPEQAAGDAVDARADLYAWGLMAYELLAGRHPFAGKTSAQQLIAAQIAEAPTPLGTVAPAVPRALAALVMACLAKAPAERPANAGALLAALDATPSASGSHPTDARTRRLAPLALAGVALLVLAGGAWAWRSRAGAVAGVPATASDAPPLVAVLPFETSAGAGGVVADSTFGEGLGDAITGKLARLQGLRVIDRASVRSVDGAAQHPQAAGRTLGADYVLRATLRWARGADGQPRVQVSPVLVRVSDGTTRWAGEPAVVSPADAFTIQGTLATEVAEALDVALAPAERARLARPATTDTAAFAALERGRRLWDRAQSGTQSDQMQALREFERAYQRDPQYADALGWAAHALRRVAQYGGLPLGYDSAAVLARRALALDPGQPEAVFTLSMVALRQGRPAEGLQLVEHAARAFPSSALLQSHLASIRLQAGDSVGAVDAVTRAVALAPRSLEVFVGGMRAMALLRRFDDVRDLLARARALEPEAPSVQIWEAYLAWAAGDTAGLSRAVRVARANGALHGALNLFLLLSSDAALRQELATSSLASVGAMTARDSDEYYFQKAGLFLARGEAARARALADSGYRVVTALLAGLPAGTADAAFWLRELAWYAAARGDRPAALAALARAAADPLIPGRPGGQEDAAQTCYSARVYGLLGDTEAMLPHLRRCLTMVNGSPLAQLSDPAFARLRADPRMRALAAELAAAQAHAQAQARARRSLVRAPG